MRSDQLDVALVSKPGVQRIAVIGTITNQAFGIIGQCRIDHGVASALPRRGSQDAHLAAALRRLDLHGIMAVQNSAFTSVGTCGETADYAAALEYSRRLVTTFDTIYHVDNRIRTLEVRGAARDTGVVDVCQELSRQQRLGDGVPRRVDTSALQTETWIRRPAGWRRLRVENVRGTRWFVAGKRVDATQPYDPQAPPYVPANDPPTECGLR